MYDWMNHTTLYTEMHLRELRVAAERARQLREVRGPRHLRRQMGGFLVTAGERLAR